MFCCNARAPDKNFPKMACVCRRPTFSETKRVLYSLLSVFEPSSHAVQALNTPAKPAAHKPAKHSPQKAPAAVTEPEPEPVKVPLPLTAGLCMLCLLCRGLAFHHTSLHGTWVQDVSMIKLLSSDGLVTFDYKGACWHRGQSGSLGRLHLCLTKVPTRRRLLWQYPCVASPLKEVGCAGTLF